MDEKKLTDEEIVKALEHCASEGTCKGCVKYNGEITIDYFKCMRETKKQVAEIIHRLQSENAELTISYRGVQNQAAKRIVELTTQNAEQKAEIERLKGFISAFETVIQEKDEQIEKKVEEIYSDFMKEYKFAKNDLKESLEREAELQKQVDKLKDERRKELLKANMFQGGFDAGRSSSAEELAQLREQIEHMKVENQQAVKGTAKEIYLWLEDKDKRGMTTPFNMVLGQLKERYGVEVE